MYPVLLCLVTVSKFWNEDDMAGQSIPVTMISQMVLVIGYIGIGFREGFNNPSHGNFPLRGRGSTPLSVNF